MLIVLLLLMLVLGFYPSRFINLARGAGIEPQTSAADRRDLKVVVSSSNQSSRRLGAVGNPGAGPQ